MNMIRPTTLLAAFVGFSALACAQTAQPTRVDAEQDTIFKAMLQELDRTRNELQLKGFEKPFFIQYRLEDVDTFDTRAEFGAGEGSSRTRQRVARVTVRVGDYKTDSSGQRGDGAVQLAALNDDPIAIRCALWTATDQAYKNALSAFAQKQAELKQVQSPPQADDFSKEKPVVVLEQPRTLVVYRVYVDGRPDELVRGVSIVGTPLAAMKRIVATSDKSEVFNGECGAESGTVPVSAVAPAMLMSEMETQRQPQGTSRPPILPIPGAKVQGTGIREQGIGHGDGGEQEGAQ